MPDDYIEQLLSSRQKYREPTKPPSYDEVSKLQQMCKMLEGRFDSLLAVVKLFGEADTLEGCLRALVEYGQMLVPFEAIELMKMDATEQHMLLYSMCYEGKIKWDVVLHFKGTELEEVVKQQRISLVGNLREEPEIPVSDVVHIYHIMSILQIPVASKDQFWGFLNFYNRKPHAFKEIHLEIAQFFCTLLALYFDKIILKEKVDYFKSAAAESSANSSSRKDISHFLRNELEAVQNKVIERCGAVSERKFGKLSDKQTEMINEIKEFADTTIRRIGHLDEYLLLSGGGVYLERRKIDLGRSIQDTLDKMKPKIDRRSLRVFFEIDKRFPPVVADYKIFQRIMVALIENAVEASKHGAPLRINVSEEKGSAVIAVIDYGDEIDPLDFENLFTPFKSIEHTLTPKRGKMFLNLPIIKSLVELSDGKIWLESEKDVDTTFYFTLPIAKQA